MNDSPMVFAPVTGGDWVARLFAVASNRGFDDARLSRMVAAFKAERRFQSSNEEAFAVAMREANGGR